MSPSDPQDDEFPSRPIHELSDREILILTCERQAVQNRRLNSLHEKSIKQEDRISSLETWRTYLTGAWAAVCIAGAALWNKKVP